MGFIKKWLSSDDQDVFETTANDSSAYYTVNTEESLKENDGKNKMILLEPRAYSESQTIADHLKSRNSVVVNFKRVTTDQAKRIIDFLSGTLYAIGGDLQKIGEGIYLCTPKNIDVQGTISEEEKTNDNGEDW